ncbi:MAG: polyphenol oxidase family protein [Patescibacteria group bacterium]
MLRKTFEGKTFFEYDLFQQYAQKVSHAVLSRHIAIDDVHSIQTVMSTRPSHSEAKQLKRPKGATSPVQPVSFANQMHGTEVWKVDEANKNESRGGDILITSVTQTPLLIRIADCASIMIFDPEKNIIANVHAGWRGLCARIIRKTISELKTRFSSSPKDLLAAISPMIGPCCCRFSDPQKELPEFMHRHIAEENMVNLWAAVEGELRECGVLKKNIENPRVCTSCHPEDFYSYRRDGETPGNKARFGTAIMLR